MNMYQNNNLTNNEPNENPPSGRKEAYNNPSKRYRRTQIPNDNIISSRNNIQRPKEEEVSRNENYPRNMKYVIRLGKNLDNQKTDSEDKNFHTNRSAYLNKGDRGGSLPYPTEESYKGTQNLKKPKISLNRINNSQYNALNDLTKKNPKENNEFKNPQKKNLFRRIPTKYNNRKNDREEEYLEKRPNYMGLDDFEISSINEDDKNHIKNARSPEPKLPPRIANIIANRYKEEENKIRYPNMRNKNSPFGYRRQRIVDEPQNTDDEVDNLIQIIEDLKNNIKDQKHQIRNLKIDNIKKDKEINTLNNELDNLQKELEDKKIEQEILIL